MLLAGEVDCIMTKPDEMDVEIPWVELKTSAYEPEETPKTRRKWESKLLRFWAQSFLLGVPTIVVGLRTQDGYLRTLRTLEVQKLPNQVKQMQGSWDGNVCVNTVAAFLEFLKTNVMGKEGVWRVKMRNYGREQRFIELFQVEETGTGKIIESGFKEHRERLLAMAMAEKNGEVT
jgi:RAT1-interacting protein